ncbi:MAG: hypothetical protein H6922_05145 [Pseudomonadaceae bacterium]|nr:hypothetical protein [Pseudomonadaceae bacterium]
MCVPENASEILRNYCLKHLGHIPPGPQRDAAIPRAARTFLQQNPHYDCTPECLERFFRSELFKATARATHHFRSFEMTLQ